MTLGTETCRKLKNLTKKVPNFKQFYYKNKKVINLFYTSFYRMNIPLLASEDVFEILIIVFPKWLLEPKLT